LPGVRGVGPKGAAALLRQYGTVEQAIAEGRFVEQADELKLYKRLATMDASAPLPPLDDQVPAWDKGQRWLADGSLPVWLPVGGTLGVATTARVMGDAGEAASRVPDAIVAVPDAAG